jgi:two-component system OmpR family response regulator
MSRAGAHVLLAIKRMAPKTPVIILTAKTDPADRFWAMQSGADAFLNKPIDPVLVVEKLKELLGAS